MSLDKFNMVLKQADFYDGSKTSEQNAEKVPTKEFNTIEQALYV